MVYVSDCGTDETPPEFPLPHPLSKLNPITPTTISGRTWNSRRLFQPTQKTRAASALIGNSGPAGRRIAAIDTLVVTFSVVEATPADGVTVCGEKMHVAPEGNPAQLKETVELKPNAGVTEIEVVPYCPAATVDDAGVAATEKSGGMV
jgi:hypothetical protein